MNNNLVMHQFREKKKKKQKNKLVMHVEEDIFKSIDNEMIMQRSGQMKQKHIQVNFHFLIEI